MSLNSTADIDVLEQIYIGRKLGICGGEPIILGTRIRVIDIVELAGLGNGSKEILKNYPHLNLEQVDAALRYYSNHPDIERDEEDVYKGVLSMRKNSGVIGMV